MINIASNPDYGQQREAYSAFQTKRHNNEVSLIVVTDRGDRKVTITLADEIKRCGWASAFAAYGRFGHQLIADGESIWVRMKDVEQLFNEGCAHDNGDLGQLFIKDDEGEDENALLELFAKHIVEYGV